jgi:hypothetical protein
MGRSDEHNRSFKEIRRRKPHEFSVIAVVLEPASRTRIKGIGWLHFENNGGACTPFCSKSGRLPFLLKNQDDWLAANRNKGGVYTLFVASRGVSPPDHANYIDSSTNM